MGTLQWREAAPAERGSTEEALYEATHGTTTLRVWHSTDADQWGWAILEQSATGQQTETSAAGSRAQAQRDVEARARERRLIP